MPELAVPFGVVGAAAGWLSVALLSNPIVEMTLPNKRIAGVVVSAIVAALVGLYLSRRCAPAPVEAGEEVMPDLRAGLIRTRLVAAVILGGAAAGAAVGAIAAPNLDRIAFGFGTGALDGALAGLAFLPLSALVLGAARRSVRARRGSIVAGVDARSVVSALAAALGVMTLLGLPDWPSARAGGEALPFVAVAIAGACILAVAAVLAADVVALRRLRRIGVEVGAMERLDGANAATDRKGVATIDLGLGQTVVGRIARGDAYRIQARAVAVLRGDAGEAMRVVRRAINRGAVAAAALVGVIALHARASAADVELAYDDALCHRGAVESCAAAARVATLELGEDTLAWGYEEIACERGDAASCAKTAERTANAHATELAGLIHERACKLGRFQSCEAADRLAMGSGANGAAELEALCGHGSLRRCMLDSTEDQGEVISGLRACYRGDGVSCRATARRLKDGPISGARAFVPALLERACRGGDSRACCDAAVSYAYGTDAPVDYQRAHVLYERARELGFMTSACDRLPARVLGN